MDYNDEEEAGEDFGEEFGEEIENGEELDDFDSDKSGALDGQPEGEL